MKAHESIATAVADAMADKARGEHRWVAGQTAICARRDDGLVSAMDMVCSGYRHP